MDLDLILGLIIGLIVMCFLGMCIITVTERIINNPFASEDALQQCLSRGYDYAESFERPIFSQEARGVKCGIIEINKKNINIDSIESVPVVVS